MAGVLKAMAAAIGDLAESLRALRVPVAGPGPDIGSRDLIIRAVQDIDRLAQTADDLSALAAVVAGLCGPDAALPRRPLAKAVKLGAVATLLDAGHWGPATPGMAGPAGEIDWL